MDTEPLNCGNCGASVIAGRRDCPYCGSAICNPVLDAPPPIPEQPKPRFILIAVLLLILASSYMFISFNKQENSKQPDLAADNKITLDLKKGILTFRVLNRNQYPTALDALIQVESASGLKKPEYIETGLAADHVALDYLTSQQFGKLAEMGIDSLMYIANDQNPLGKGNCKKGNISRLILNKDNAVVSGNIFLSEHSNGCGIRMEYRKGQFSVTQKKTDRNPDAFILPDDEIPVMMWSGGAETLTGKAEANPYNEDGNMAFMVTGVGRSSNLFSIASMGRMVSVPVYKNADESDYNRFMAVWYIGTYQDGKIIMADQIRFVTVLGGSGETVDAPYSHHRI